MVTAPSRGAGACGSYLAKAFTRRLREDSYYTRFRWPGKHHEEPVGSDGLHLTRPGKTE